MSEAVLNTPAPRKKPYSLRKMAVGSTIRVTQLVLYTAVGLWLTPFTVHTLGSELYGVWALAGAFIGFYSILDLGLSGAVFTRMSHAIGAGDEDTGSRIYSTGLRLFSGMGVFLLLLTVCVATGLSIWHPRQGWTLGIVVLILGLQTALSFPMRAPFGVLNAGGHFEMTSAASILATFLRAVGTYLVLRAGKGVVGLAVVSILAWVPGWTLVLFAVHWRYPFIKLSEIRQIHKETVRSLRNFALPVLIGELADRIRLQTDGVVVSLFLGLSAVTHYNVATTLVMYYRDGIVAIIGVLTPVLAMQKSGNDHEGLRRTLLVGTRLGLCTAGFAAFGLVAWGRAFIERWMGSTYRDAYPLLVILVVSMFVDLVQSTTVNALYATLHQGLYAKINVCEAVANLLLSLALARTYGMIGVALGTLIPSVGRLFIQPFLVRKILNLSVGEYFSTMIRSGIRVALCLVLPYIFTRLWLRPDYRAMLLVGTLSVIAFAAPIWYFEFAGAGWSQVRARLRLSEAKAGGV